MAFNSPELSKYIKLLGDIGRAELNSLFPNDFEYYICSLELVDSQEKTIQFFIFPIMPDNLEEEKGYIQNIRKTFGGVSVLTTNTFTTNQIILKGNFGRKMKFLLGNELTDSNAFAAVQEHSQVKEFSSKIKTGFGCIKILERICDMSKQVDTYGNPYRLYFYNPALGNSYQVEVTAMSIPQGKDTNMIWNYSLTLTCVAPLVGMLKQDDLKRSLSNTLSFSIIQKSITSFKDSLLTQFFKDQNEWREQIKYITNVG